MVRIKERYILVNILYPPITAKDQASEVPGFVVLRQPTSDELTPLSLIRAIQAEVATLFGDYGLGAITGSLTVKYLSKATSTFILRVRRAHYRMVWAALTTIDRVPLNQGPGKYCTFQVAKVSGTIRKVEEGAVRQARQLVLAAKVAQTGQASMAAASPFTASLSSGFSSNQNLDDAPLVDVEESSDDGQGIMLEDSGGG